MSNFNRVIMAGNLTRDPDYKQSSTGQPVCRLSLASNRQYKNRNTGMLVQEVCFVDIDVWGNQAESCRQYLQKGRPILVEGRLKFDTWESEGQTKRRHSIVADKVVFLGSNQQSDTNQDEAFNSNSNSNSSSFSQSASKKTNQSSDPLFKDEQPFEDDLPF